MIEACSVLMTWQLAQYCFINKQKPISMCLLGWEVNISTQIKPFAFDTDQKAA